MSVRAQRRLLPALLCVTVLALTACGSGTDNTSAEAQTEDRTWSYTSGSGETVTLDHQPERIIASAAEAGGLLAYGIRPVGIYLAQDIKWEPGLQEYDISDIPIVGEEWGKIDAEQVAALQPDLIVADWWPPQNAYQGFEEGVDDESMKVSKLAPIIGASQQGSLEELVAWYEGFAQSMGIDVDSDEYAQAKQEFEDAKQSFEDAVAAKPELSALAVAPAPDMLYVAVPEYSTSLTDFKSWGLDVIEPDSPKPDFPYWEYLSWEKADKYQPDLLLMDDRGYEENIKIGESQPTWDDMTAAKAKQYAKWPGYWVHTYHDYAEQLQQLTNSIEQANPNIT